MKGIIYAILATISYSSTPTFTQLGYKGGIQTNTLLFSRHLVSLICMLPIFLRKESYATLERKHIPWILLLCVMAIFGNVTFNYAYHYLPNMVSIAVSISYVAFVFVIEMLIGREKFTRTRGFIACLTFLGLAVIAIPGMSGGLDMKAFGFDAPVEPTEVKEDDFEEEAEDIQTKCQTGEIWVLGNHRLMCGDTANPDDMSALMGGG